MKKREMDDLVTRIPYLIQRGGWWEDVAEEGVGNVQCECAT